MYLFFLVVIMFTMLIIVASVGLGTALPTTFEPRFTENTTTTEVTDIRSSEVPPLSAVTESTLTPESAAATVSTNTSTDVYFIGEDAAAANIEEVGDNGDENAVVTENPTVCERGYRFLSGSCIQSVFSQRISDDGFDNTIYPVCESDLECPINAVCGEQGLCKCVHGLPTGEAACEASSLGQECNDNVVCKSWLNHCVESVCRCKPGRFETEGQCVRSLSLDNYCGSSSVPCGGKFVECLSSGGSLCNVSDAAERACTCRCMDGYIKNEGLKVCELPATTTTTTMTTEIPKPQKERSADEVTQVPVPTSDASKSTLSNMVAICLAPVYLAILFLPPVFLLSFC